MRLTELSLRLDRERDGVVSDGHYWGAIADLAAMAIAIPSLFPGMWFPMRPYHCSLVYHWIAVHIEFIIVMALCAILCDPGYYEVRRYTGPGIAEFVARSKQSCEAIIMRAQKTLIDALTSAKEVRSTTTCKEVSKHCRRILQGYRTPPTKQRPPFDSYHFMKQ